MPGSPPLQSLTQEDDIPTIHVNLPSCYLKPAGSAEPQLPDGTFSCDAQEDYWKPSPNDPKRQQFRIQGQNEFVFIAGAQYTYRPNTSLHIKCKKATFMPHPTDPSQKTVIVRMPGADAEQNSPAKAGEGERGAAASFRIDTSAKEFSWDMFIDEMQSTGDKATRGSDGMGGATGSQGADAGSLTIEADSYDMSALLDDKVFLIAECTGGKGQQGGDGGDGGGGGDGAVTAGINQSGGLKRYVGGMPGVKGGNGGRQGAGGYGGSGGQFTIKLPKESADVDELKARFGIQSNIGTPGTTGAAGKPGPGGRYGKWSLFKFRWGNGIREFWLSELLQNHISKDKLEEELRSKFELDLSFDDVKQWMTDFIRKTESSSVIGDVPKALDEQEIQDRRAHAGQHEPTTSPNVVFKEVTKQ